MYIDMYMSYYMYIYIYREREREIHAHVYKQTNAHVCVYIYIYITYNKYITMIDYQREPSRQPNVLGEGGPLAARAPRAQAARTGGTQ